MTSPSFTSDTDALRRAAQAFTRLLASRACLDLTARIDAVVHAARAEPVFAVEAALKSAWPAARPAPVGEVVWGTTAGDACLDLQAFDGAGRLLLRRSYDRQAAEAGK